MSAAKISGNLTANSGAALVGCAIYVPNQTNPKFSVDSAGNVNMLGNLTLSNGSISWGNLAGTVQNRITSVESNVSNLESDVSRMGTSIDNKIYNLNNRVDGVEYDIASLSNSAWTQQEIQNIASTQIESDLIASPHIYGATIQGGYIDGAYFKFSDYGYIYYDEGNDGYSTTKLVHIDSTTGMLLSATNGLGLSAGKGVWFTDNTRVSIQINGRWVCLNEVLVDLGY